jgi:olfactory receptor
MYIFLGNLALMDACCSCAITPKTLENFFSEDRRISLYECMAQFYFLCLAETADCFLLAAMAYDRYVAICNPLHYSLVMNHKVCMQLVAASWISGIPVQIGQTYQTFSLPFCRSNIIGDFFCEFPPVLKLVCGMR